MSVFGLVDVKCIFSKKKRSDFPEDSLNQLANSILENQELLKPLILKQISIESFEVIEGHFEFYSAVRAKEINPRLGEMVNAFVISEQEEPWAVDQIQIIRNTINDSSQVVRSLIPTQTTDNSSWITSFELRLSEMRESLFQSQRENENRFNEIERLIEKESENNLLTLINSLEKDKLIVKLSKMNFPIRKIEAICEARSKKKDKKFSDFSDIVKSTKGLGTSSLLRLIDIWDGLNKK